MGRRAGAAALAAVTALATAEKTRAGESALEIGRRIYREGRQASGEPLAALVAGDVPISGTQLSCQSCHGRSGMGAGEGAILVPPVSALLFEPSPQRRRPGYDTHTLAVALRQGLDPSGRSLAPLMPRYSLSDPEVTALGAYLRGLSSAPAPGVSDEEIRFATVFSDDVARETRAAMLDVVERFVAEKARETRLESRRIGHGAPPGEWRPPTYRKWRLEVWDLQGPPQGWEGQLEARYSERPVFALLSGASSDWGPIGRFCEKHEIPSLLPSTDLAELPEGAFYTLHFSRGLFLEADLVDRHLAPGAPRRVVQVYRASEPGAGAARRLAIRLGERGIPVEDVPLAEGEAPPRGSLAGRVDGADVVLWLTREDVVRIGRLDAARRVYISSTLLARRLEGLATGAAAYVAHPFVLPREPDPALRRFRLWLRRAGGTMRDERRQAEAYFACLAANEGLKHAGRYFVRDFVLDSLDHAQGLVAYLPLRPSPGAGPGQRFLGKGGYVVPLEAGRLREEEARWIVP